MLTKIEIRAPGTAPALTLDVVVPNASTRYLVHNVEGLGPVKSSISTAPLGQLKGTDYTGSSVAERNIVIDFEYKPNYAMAQTAYDLRQELYAFAGPEKNIELTLHIDGVGTRTIEGYVESVESPMFSKDLTGQISVLCPIPWFVGEKVKRTLTPNTNIVIDYPGDIPSGPTFVYKTPTTGDVTALRMIRTHAQEGTVTLGMYGYLNQGMQLSRDMVITVDMRDRYKRAAQWNGRNLLPILSSFNWWKMLPGSNTVRFEGFYRASDPNNDGPIPNSPTYELSYDVYYGGL